jgi:BirA family biotin operon repressor/biotin-[acetyl-CoA-carboxylase] ligase
MEPIVLPAEALRALRTLRETPSGVSTPDLARALDVDAAAVDGHVALLRDHEYDIAGSFEDGYRLVAPPDRLLTHEIQPHLDTIWAGQRLHCYEDVESTNDVARRLGREGSPTGTAVLAEAQSRGRGRLGRSWISPPRRNLYLSVILRPRVDLARLAQVSLMAGVAACEAVAEWHPAAIKWPNDVLIGSRKVVGILTELEGDAADRFVILGIGVNLNSEMDDFPDDLQDKAGSLRVATGQRVDRVRFAARLLNRIEAWHESWEGEGFRGLADAWHRHSCLRGRDIEVATPEGLVAGTALGLDEDGALRVRLHSGREQRIVAGDVTVIGGYGGGGGSHG